MKKNLQLRALSHGLFWAMPKAKAEFMIMQLGLVDGSAHDAEYQAAVAARGMADSAEQKPYDMYGSTAIITMTGVMTRAGSSFGDGSTVEMRRQIRKAIADADVRTILLSWDSPGGSVDGLEELADDIAMARTKKPVYSFFTECCSAAMWCAVQADAVYCTRTAYGGSLGVFSYAVDMSRYAESEGIKVTLYTTGKHKGVGVPGVPITDEQHAENQRVVDIYGQHFREAVSRGRDMSMDDVEEIFDGRCWVGQELVSVGLVDSITSLDDLLLSLNAAKAKGSVKRAASAEAVHPDNDLASDESPAPIAGTLKAALDLALTAGVEASEAATVAMTRAKDVASIRKGQSRSFSAERLAQLRDLAEVTHTLNAHVAGLLQECEALGHDTPVAETAPDEPSAPDPAFEALRVASVRSRELLGA